MQDYSERKSRTSTGCYYQCTSHVRHTRGLSPLRSVCVCPVKLIQTGLKGTNTSGIESSLTVRPARFLVWWCLVAKDISLKTSSRHVPFWWFWLYLNTTHDDSEYNCRSMIAHSLISGIQIPGSVCAYWMCVSAHETVHTKICSWPFLCFRIVVVSWRQVIKQSLHTSLSQHLAALIPCFSGRRVLQSEQNYSCGESKLRSAFTSKMWVVNDIQILTRDSRTEVSSSPTSSKNMRSYYSRSFGMQ